MPRPSKGKSFSRYQTGALIAPIRMPEAAREDLLDLLNCDERAVAIKKQILGTIEQALGHYQFYKEELDERPRPAQRAAELRPLLEICRKALNRFRELSDDARQDILSQASDLKRYRKLNRFPGHLRQMTTALESVCAYLKKNESRHGKTHMALTQTIKLLAGCFNEYYQPDEEEDRSSQISQFIRSALKAGKIRFHSLRTIERHLSAPSPFS